MSSFQLRCIAAIAEQMLGQHQELFRKLIVRYCTKMVSITLPLSKITIASHTGHILSVPFPMRHSASNCSCLSCSAVHSPQTPFVYALGIHGVPRDQRISGLELVHLVLVARKLLVEVVLQIFVLKSTILAKSTLDKLRCDIPTL